MPFSHKPRPGFELHFIPPPGCRRLSSGRPPRRARRLSARDALALALVALVALATSAGAEPASTAASGVIAQAAPAAARNCLWNCPFRRAARPGTARLKPRAARDDNKH